MELCGKRVFPIGLGTWKMGGGYWTPDRSKDEMYISAIKYAISRGINVIDTAEMYGGGHTEELVGRAVEDWEDIVVITKVWPTNLKHVKRQALKSLERLGAKEIDLYLVHWPPQDVTVEEVIRDMNDLVDQGIVRCIGVSNFDEKLLRRSIEASRREIEVDEVEFNVFTRPRVVDYAREMGVKVVAYSPLSRGEIVGEQNLRDIGKKYGKTEVQVSLNYLSREALPIPKAVKREHIDEIVGSVGFSLSPEDIARIGSLAR